MVLEFMKVVSLFWIWIQTNDYTAQAEDLEMEFKRKVVSLPWIWKLTNDYIAHAELIGIHEG